MPYFLKLLLGTVLMTLLPMGHASPSTDRVLPGDTAFGIIAPYTGGPSDPRSRVGAGQAPTRTDT